MQKQYLIGDEKMSKDFLLGKLVEEDSQHLFGSRSNLYEMKKM